jgi:hypothetical protein
VIELRELSAGTDVNLPEGGLRSDAIAASSTDLDLESALRTLRAAVQARVTVAGVGPINSAAFSSQFHRAYLKRYLPVLPRRVETNISSRAYNFAKTPTETIGQFSAATVHAPKWVRNNIGTSLVCTYVDLVPTSNLDIQIALPTSTASYVPNTAMLDLLCWFSDHHVDDSFDGYDNYEVADWDGYGAEAITRETVRAAREMLGFIPKNFPEPEIAPGADGSIGFEWIPGDSSIRKLFIDVGPGSTWTAYWRLASGEKGSIPRQVIDSTTSRLVEIMFLRLGVVDVTGRR